MDKSKNKKSDDKPSTINVELKVIGIIYFSLIKEKYINKNIFKL